MLARLARARSRGHRHRRGRRHGRRAARRTVRRRPRRLQLAVQPGDRGAPAGVLRRRRVAPRARRARSSSRRSCPRIRRARAPSSPCARCRRTRGRAVDLRARSRATQRAFGHFVSFVDGERVRLRPWAVRYATPDELDATAAAAGFAVADRWEDFDRHPFEDDQSEACDGVCADQVTLRNRAARFAPDHTPRAYPEQHCEPVASQPTHRAVGHDRGRAGEATERLRATGTGDRWRSRAAVPLLPGTRRPQPAARWTPSRTAPAGGGCG